MQVAAKAEFSFNRTNNAIILCQKPNRISLDVVHNASSHACRCSSVSIDTLIRNVYSCPMSLVWLKRSRVNP